MIQYEDLDKLEYGYPIYIVDDSNSKNTILELKFSGKNNKKYMLIHPDFYRIDIYKDSPNPYIMFSSESDARAYAKEKNNVLKEKIIKMSTEEMLKIVFDFYEECYELDYEAPYQPISKNELLLMKEVLWERLNLK